MEDLFYNTENMPLALSPVQPFAINPFFRIKPTVRVRALDFKDGSRRPLTSHSEPLPLQNPRPMETSYVFCREAAASQVDQAGLEHQVHQAVGVHCTKRNLETQETEFPLRFSFPRAAIVEGPLSEYCSEKISQTVRGITSKACLDGDGKSQKGSDDEMRYR